MRPLTNKLIYKLRCEKSDVDQPCILYSVEYKDTIILTDNTFLMEWPIDMVDTDCKQYKQLAASRKNHSSYAQKLREVHWKKQLIYKDRFLPCKEVGPTEEEIEAFSYRKQGGGTAVFSAEDARWHFHSSYFSMILESFDEDPIFKIYKPFKEQNTPTDIRMLCVFDRKQLVGLVMHQPYCGPIVHYAKIDEMEENYEYLEN